MNAVGFELRRGKFSLSTGRYTLGEPSNDAPDGHRRASDLGLPHRQGRGGDASSLPRVGR